MVASRLNELLEAFVSKAREPLQGKAQSLHELKLYENIYPSAGVPLATQLNIGLALSIVSRAEMAVIAAGVVAGVWVSVLDVGWPELIVATFDPAGFVVLSVDADGVFKVLVDGVED